MSIITGLLSLLVVAAVVGLFIKRFRKRSAIVFVAAFAAVAIIQNAQTGRLDIAAQEAGFLSHQDLLDANEAGVSSLDEWNLSRATRE